MSRASLSRVRALPRGLRLPQPAHSQAGAGGSPGGISGLAAPPLTEVGRARAFSPLLLPCRVVWTVLMRNKHPLCMSDP